MSIHFFMIYCRPVLFSAFNLKDASYLDQWDRCGCPFERNLSHRGWSFVKAALKPFSRFVTGWHFVLMSAVAEIQSRTGRIMRLEGRCLKLSCWGEEPPQSPLPNCAPKLLSMTSLKTELLVQCTEHLKYRMFQKELYSGVTRELIWPSQSTADQ
jgi:hypothetical protein